jgi:hypothetical protein
MTSAPVGQLAALAELFGEVWRSRRPESVAILGVAGGNGLEHIHPSVTRRVCGVDINPEYLEAARRRFAGLPGLELHCLDLAEQAVPLAPVELVHCGPDLRTCRTGSLPGERREHGGAGRRLIGGAAVAQRCGASRLVRRQVRGLP